MTDIAIRVENLSKQYRIGRTHQRHDTLRDALVGALQAPLERLRGDHRGGRAETIWALKDVSFEVHRGEVVGIIGRNGAGKSTLLKVLSRITRPTKGCAEIHGRIGSLLEVGTGFHPELTGRENITLNGAILGMKRAEIDRKFPEIVDFAEIEKFIDTPVKHYSSGMYVRLAFAVAAHLEPEILLVDEVLAVGDLAFQKKCLGKMQDVSREGRTVLFVSHGLASIRRLCARVLLLSCGVLVKQGPTDQVVEEYLRLSRKTADTSTVTDTAYSENRQLPTQVRRVRLTDEAGNTLGGDQVIAGSFRIQILYHVREPVQSSYILCKIRNQEEVDIVWTYDGDTEQFGNRRPGFFLAEFVVPQNMLTSGVYGVHCAVVDTNRGTIDYTGAAFSFEVEDIDSLLAHRNIPWPGITRFNPPWSTTAIDSASEILLNAEE